MIDTRVVLPILPLANQKENRSEFFCSVCILEHATRTSSLAPASRQYACTCCNYKIVKNARNAWPQMEQKDVKVARILRRKIITLVFSLLARCLPRNQQRTNVPSPFKDLLLALQILERMYVQMLMPGLWSTDRQILYIFRGYMHPCVSRVQGYHEIRRKIVNAHPVLVSSMNRLKTTAYGKFPWWVYMYRAPGTKMFSDDDWVKRKGP